MRAKGTVDEKAVEQTEGEARPSFSRSLVGSSSSRRRRWMEKENEKKKTTIRECSPSAAASTSLTARCVLLFAARPLRRPTSSSTRRRRHRRCRPRLIAAVVVVVLLGKMITVMVMESTPGVFQTHSPPFNPARSLRSSAARVFQSLLKSSACVPECSFLREKRPPTKKEKELPSLFPAGQKKARTPRGADTKKKTNFGFG